MRVNVSPQLYQTVIRRGQEYSVNAATEWQVGATETVIIRLRNVNPTGLPVAGSVSLVMNGHTPVAPQVEWGIGDLDAQGRFVGPTRMEVSPVTLIAGGATNLTVNVRIPYGMYLEFRVQIQWGNVDTPPVAVFGGWDGTADVPEMIVRGPDATGFAALGSAPPAPPVA